ncbi:MAG: hypothetical protein M3P82_00740 [Bacteroidota bacterium]|nr:hypothetical protein [Bacteroidota bacterium]
MKKIIPVLILLLLPLFFFIGLQKYKDAVGEYYLGRNYDPSYPYLTNALNLSQFNGYGVGLIAHPGTPVQELGAAVILIAHSLEAGKTDLVRDVFNNAEYYLIVIFQFCLLLNSIAIFILGITAYRKLKSLTSAVFLQLTPFAFYSEDIFFHLSNVSVEPILVFTVLLLITTIILFTNRPQTGKNLLFYTIIFGLLCGLGMATKISFFPILVIPFLLIKQLKFKILFIGISILAFFIIVYPAFSAENAEGFSVWVKDIIIHSGRYGTGSQDFVKTSVYFDNVRSIFSYSLIFSITYLSLLIIFIMQFFESYKTRIRTHKYFTLLCGILIAMSLQIFTVAKHFGIYYMIPTYMFSILGLFIVNSVMFSLYPDFFKIKNKRKYYYAIISLAMIVFTVFQLRTIYKYRKYITSSRNESRKIVKILDENYPNTIVVSSYECSSKEFALFLGSSYGGTQNYKYMSILKAMYPNDFYFNRWDNKFYHYWDIENIKTQLIKANKFIFQGVSDEVALNFLEYVKVITNKPNAYYNKIMSGYDRDVLYEITLE